MKRYLLPVILSFTAHAAETTLKDSEGRSAYLYTPTDTPEKNKTYWLAIGAHGGGGDGKKAGGIADWAKDDVIVLGPSFSVAEKDGDEEKTLPPEAYQMAGPAHVEKVKALIAEVAKIWKIHPKVFLHGFSAGAQFVHRFAMKEPELVAGVSSASAGTWSTRGFGEINPAASRIPFAISCGQYDQKKSKAISGAPLSRLEWMHEFAEALHKAHFDVEARVIPNIGHKHSDDTSAFAATAFQRAKALNYSRTVLLSCDFNDTNPLWAMHGDAKQSPEGNAVTAMAAWRSSAGMIEKQGSAEHTGGLRLMVNSLPAVKTWSGALTTGLLPVRSVETDLAKLTLAFDLSSTQARAVRVVIESFDAEHKRSGGLEGTVIPAAPQFYHRHTLDLGAMKAAGDGEFKASDPFIQISFIISNDLGWAATTGHELLLDNLCYTAPALYVSTKGDDKKGKGTLEAPRCAMSQGRRPS